ncbi:MAG: magnesium transporter, partial [Oscillospiraceae bacterium]|nr:magnesium transporter [Oscillospiraceae bacterium]
PMLMSTGGNCGSQSSTTIIRGLATGEIQFSDFLKVAFKEFRISLIVSTILALTNGLRILIMYRDIQLAAVITLSIMGTVIIAKFIGCALPLAAKKIKLDPAIMAAPLISTILDTCSMLIYFQIATMIFEQI